MSELNELKRVVGEENFSDSAEEKLAYARDSSQEEGALAGVVWPENVVQVQRVVKWAARNRVCLVPRGGGTGRCGGAVPSENSVVVCLSRMNSVKVNAKARECVCGAGAVLDEVNRLAGVNGLWFPVVPSSHGACMVGGMISTNAAGLRAVRYGKTGDWVREVVAVDGRGRVMRRTGGGEFIGTEGVLGIVVEARLKLAERPAEGGVELIEVGDYGGLVEEIDSLKKNKNLSALEYLDEKTSSALGFGKKMLLIAEFEGGGVTGREAEEVWKKREAAYPVLALDGYPVTEDPFIPLGELPVFLEWCEKNRVPVFGHAGVSVFHPRFRKGQGELIREMHSLVNGLGGTPAGEHGYGLLKKKFLPIGERRRLKGLKKKFDPKGLLNAGKVL